MGFVRALLSFRRAHRHRLALGQITVRTLLWFACGAGALSGACTLNASGTAPEGSGAASQGGHGTGAGPTGGSGGTAPECELASDCPGSDNTCATRTCANLHCGHDFAAPLTPCNFGGGQVCDGAGHCLIGIGGTCTTTPQCQAGTCVDGVCCSTACAGLCESCDGSTPGSCLPATPGTDPDTDCAGGVCDTGGGCAHGTFAWAKSYGNPGNDDDEIYAVTVDGLGNTIVVGYYSGTIRFGGPTDLTSAGGTDVFVAKLDANGIMVWQKGFGSAGNQWASAVTTDASNNVLVAGTFEGTLNLGGGVPMTSAGGTDVFVAKLDSNGGFVWQNRYGDGANQGGTTIGVANNGDVYAAGTMQGAPDFGAGTFTTSGTDTWLLGLTAGGAFRWARQYGTTGDQTPGGLAVGTDNNVVIVGSNTGVINFGGPTTHTSAGAEDLFIAKINSNGTEAWSQRRGDTMQQFANNVALGPANEVFVVGSFFGTLDFGDGALNAAGAERDVFVARLTAAGATDWSQRFGDTARQSGFGIVADAAGNIAITGVNLGSVDFGGGAVTSPGSTQGFLAKFAGSGEHLWSFGFGPTSGASNPWAIGIMPANDVVVGGGFDTVFDMGGGPLTLGGGLDAFVARFAP